MISYIISMSMSVAVGGLFLFHTFMLSKNWSTIEMNVLLYDNAYGMGTWKKNMA
jgi:hypothetical protein